MPGAIALRLSELSRADLPTAGGKGANLGELLRLGLAVPPGFVVSAKAYAEQVRQWGLAERLRPLLAASDWGAAASAVEALFQSGAMLPEIERAVRQAYAELGAGEVAVRSSATAEDLAGASFAGQHETYLGVVGEAEVLLALRRCWASLWSPRALRYRAARGIDHLGVDIAVVIQRMVPSEFAGVLFTVDPVDQRADRMRVEVAPGLGEAVVSGHTSGDVYRLRRPPFGGASTGADGVAIEDRDRQDPARPVPGDALVLELGRLGLRLESHFGCPQDVEFAFQGGSIHLLQSRPITTLGAAEIEPLPPSPRLNRVQLRALPAQADRFPVAPKPLDQWMFRYVFPALTRTIRFIGMNVDEAGERAFVNQMWREVVAMPRVRPSLRLLGLPRRVSAGLRHDWMGWWEGEAFRRIREASAPVDLRALDDQALLRRADENLEVTRAVLDKRFEGIVSMMVAVPLRLVIAAAVGWKRAGVVMGDLLSGLRTRTSEVNAALHRLSRRALDAGPEVAGPIREGRPEELRESEAGRAFLAEVAAFLDEHGYRESSGLYLSAPTWRQDPAPVWGLLRGMLDAGEPPSGEAGLERYRAAREEVIRELFLLEGLIGWFERNVERLRRTVVYRERSHFDLARGFSAVQEVAVEIARRLHERGHLADPGDVWFLTEDELRAWLGGRAPPAEEARALIRRRRATYGVVNGRWQKWVFEASAAGASGHGELRGTGASSGVVRGRARIVRGEHEFGRLKKGEILVCRYTNPAWTPLFTLAAGVVTATGGAASHAAIVAREYGLPAVLGVPGATERIADGQELLVDGAAGRVMLVKP